MKQSIDINYIHLVDEIVAFNYVLTDFLPGRPSVSDGGVWKPPTMIDPETGEKRKFFNNGLSAYITDSQKHEKSSWGKLREFF